MPVPEFKRLFGDLRYASMSLDIGVHLPCAHHPIFYAKAQAFQEADETDDEGLDDAVGVLGRVGTPGVRVFPMFFGANTSAESEVFGSLQATFGSAWFEETRALYPRGADGCLVHLCVYPEMVHYAKVCGSLFVFGSIALTLNTIAADTGQV